MQEWIEQEFGDCDLGDRRLNQRVKKIVLRMWQSPQESLSAACRGFGEVMACSRFFDNEAVSQSQLLEPHRQASLQRIKEHPRVLLIQDTTELDFTAKKKLEGAGSLSSVHRRGFFAHNQLVVTPERLPLGMWQTSIQAREDQDHGKASQRKEKTIEEKESFRWLEGYRHACDLAQLAPKTQVISCADREADIYELLAEHQRVLSSGQLAADWLIRSKSNRCLEPLEKEFLQEEEGTKPAEKKLAKQKIQERLEQSPVLGTLSFMAPAKEQFKKIKGSGGSKKKVLRTQRTVTQEVRAIQVQLQAPWRKDRSMAAVQIWVVQAKEIDAPADQEPIEWTLITSLETKDFEQAREVLGLYLCRWEIEVYHRVLKTGCRVEDLQLRTGPRMKLALLLYMIVAWRVLYVMHLGRQCPDLPCNVVFEDDEWQSSWVIIKGGSPPQNPPSLNDMVRMVASFGGFLGRKSDGHPGPQTLWVGLSRVRDFALCWQYTAHLRATGG
jgi:Transposase Tn5 dimerisation domain/Transposase DNA-binding